MDFTSSGEMSIDFIENFMMLTIFGEYMDQFSDGFWLI
jgi:hypothetical protein